MPSSRPELAGLTLAGRPEPWEQLGFTITDGEIHVGGVRLTFGPEGAGIASWSLYDTDCTDVDGLRTEPTDSDRPDPQKHDNGVTGIDHVVALTDDLDRTTNALVDAAFDHRRTEENRAFFVLGPCLLELVGPGDPPVRFWGITFVTEDIEKTADRLGEHLGEIKDAVQPGRRIATVRREAGLGFPVALITGRVGP